MFDPLIERASYNFRGEWNPQTGDAVINLGDAAGVKAFYIKDSTGKVVAKIDSLGNVTAVVDEIITGDMTIGGVLQVDGVGNSYVMGNFGIGNSSLAAWESTWSALQLAEINSIVGSVDKIVMSTNAYFVNGNIGTGAKYIKTLEASRYHQTAGTHTWAVAGSGTANTTITWTTALTIDNGGNLIAPQSISVGHSSAPSYSVDIQSSTPIIHVRDTDGGGTSGFMGADASANSMFLGGNAVGVSNLILARDGSLSTTFCGDVTLSTGAQSYLLTDRSASLVIQGQTSGFGSSLEIYSKDGDATDDINLQLWGRGIPSSTTNRERLIFNWSASRSQYEIWTEADGTGTLRPIVLYTEGNTDQIHLSANGAVGFGLAGVSGTRITLPLENDATTPTLAFGDGDTGLFELTDDSLRLAIAGVSKWQIDATRLGQASGYAALLSVTASSTVPVIVPAWSSDSNTGIGWAGQDQLSLITGGVEAVNIDASQNTTFAEDVSVGGGLGIGTSTVVSGGAIINRTTNPFVSYLWNDVGVGQVRATASDEIGITDAGGSTAHFKINTTSGNATFAGNVTVNGGFAMAGVTVQTQRPHIVDADGTLSDITTKFNTLLADLEGFGFLATA